MTGQPRRPLPSEPIIRSCEVLLSAFGIAFIGMMAVVCFAVIAFFASR